VNRWFGLRCLIRRCPAVRIGDVEAVWTECAWCGRRWDRAARAEIAARLLAMREQAEAADAEAARAPGEELGSDRDR
jgi:hypothetical protein